MSLRKNSYLNRIIDAQIDEYLQLYGAISIEGPKWCGKTWTALNHANSVIYIMDPTNNYNNKRLAGLNPSLVLPGTVPRVIDEWQEIPGIWDAVRFDIDQNPGHGKYILTGSVMPPQESYLHTGTGRIATLQMRPMTLYESGDSTGEISLGALFNNEIFEPFSANIDLIHLIDITIRGGWPETLLIPLDKSGSISIQYINSIIKSEYFHGKQSKRNQFKLHRLIRSLARNNTTMASITTLTTDVDGSERTSQSTEEIEISRHSIIEYIKDLLGIFVIEEIPAWNPEIRSKIIMRQSPKRIYTDPSLAIAALGANREKMLSDLNTYGFMFENLCLRDLSVYANYHGGSVYHYRDNSELEIDAIVELQNGDWGAFEIKLGEEKVESAVASLLRLKDKMVSAGTKPPECLVVITGGGIAECRKDGIYVLPINTLRH
ncbi:MAG: DUF4143 domain-containing protein [Oscillospiraceae bacterium]|nr:DUF4143 domain-containing protein [Oscillospiraceae bacterium]